jgi:maltooligosyltrehalose synthase
MDAAWETFDWADTRIELPEIEVESALTNVLDGLEVKVTTEGGRKKLVYASDVLRTFPVALCISCSADAPRIAA